MEIVLENPSVMPLSARMPAPSSIATATTSQLGLPIHHPPPHHFPHHTALYDVGALPAEDYYARNRHGLASSYDRDLDGSSVPVTVRRIDKSGLLEIAEADPAMCQRPRILTGAEDVATRNTMSLRVDRSGLLEAVPEAVDQPEEHCNNSSASLEKTVTVNALTTTATIATNMFDEAKAISQEKTLQTNADVNPRVFDETCCPLERPSSLEGQACSDDVGIRGHFADVKVTENPQAQFDVSMKATERLPHFSSFSPGPSLRHSKNDPSRRLSPLINRCVDANSARQRNQKSTEFSAKYTPTNSTSKNPANCQSQSLMTMSPTMLKQRSRVGCSKDDRGPTILIDSDPTVGPIKAPELLLTKGSTEQKDNDVPGEERAEAEGCEHTAIEGLEEDEVSFKGSKKFLDNDNVQTLRVIILSEQL